ncbi:hypothetical protein BDW02DRAFT_241027 [Decorospora gaudefroyi]|uniref:Uncharacterized protein n=1 Tax=Decorospora gaudefroyi TaxID=184978 RepID=A0A6A5KL70_9PLEO|nr:hypothetical protein BDW02DRAFT_241027 [Decorospora gaudefroyi]
MTSVLWHVPEVVRELESASSIRIQNQDSTSAPGHRQASTAHPFRLKVDKPSSGFAPWGLGVQNEAARSCNGLPVWQIPYISPFQTYRVRRQDSSVKTPWRANTRSRSQGHGAGANCRLKGRRRGAGSLGATARQVRCLDRERAEGASGAKCRRARTRG